MELQGSLFDVIERRSRKAGHVVAAIDDAKRPAGPSPLPATLTYAELCAAAERLSGAIAARLAEAGHAAADGEAGHRAVIATRMRRGNEWYAVFCAAARLGLPFVALSTDLTDKAAEAARNAQILAEHRPALLVTDEEQAQGWGGPPEPEALGAPAAVGFARLWAAGGAAELPAARAGDELCFCYTGGTTAASRCARVTHRMALHEVDAYPRIVDMGPADRVMQQHSLYWGASAYGEVDIALAFGCALVFCEAWDPEGVMAAVRQHQVTCAGLVPSVLGALDAKDMPSLRVVFTWGEALPAKVARDWTRHVRLIDLLISTECWLSLYADWNAFDGASERPPFRTVRRVQVRLRAPHGRAAEPSALAAQELLVAGPMVTPGYTDPRLDEAVLLEEAGVRWYCTRDCVQPCGDGGLAFAGRADDLIKVGGKWVDVREVEHRLEAVCGVAEARVCNREVFVVLEAGHGGAVPELRHALPSGFSLFVVPAMPRRAGTDKVDRRRLAELVSHAHDPSVERGEAEQCAQELGKIRRWYGALALPALASLLSAIAIAWLAAPLPGVVAAGPLAALPSLCLLAAWGLLWRLACLPYVLLPQQHWPKGAAYLNCFPFGYAGFAVFLVSALPDPLLFAWAPALICIAVSPGACLAAGRGRLFAWPLVCVVGFPLWMRTGGQWWVQQGFRGAAAWYRRKLGGHCQGLCEAARGAVSGACQWVGRLPGEARWRLLGFLGTARECWTCKARCHLADGHVDLDVDAHWHCEGCWGHYHRHRQCLRCRRWTTQGAADAAGAFTCNMCTPFLAESGAEGAGAQQEADASAGQGGGRHHGGHGWARGYAVGGGGGGGYGNQYQHRPQVQWRSFRPIEGPAGAPAPEKTAAGGPPVTSAADAAGGGAEAPPEPPAKSAEWRLIERAAGWTFSSRSDSLAGIDSLSSIKIESALRRELRVQVTREALKASSTLGQLLDEVGRAARAPLEPSCPQLQPRGREREHRAWLMMWNSRCQWTICRDRPLDQDVLREALSGLMQRHPALRTELADPTGVSRATQQALSVFGLWRAAPAGGGGRAARFVRRAAQRAASWGFKACWGRIKITEDQPPPLVVLPKCGTAEEAQRSLSKLPFFAPPFQVGLVPFGQGEEEEGALVHIVVTHMLSDGYSIVPLLADIAQLVARAEAAQTPLLPLPPALPPVPCALAALEDRLMRTIGEGAMQDAVTLEALHNQSCRQGVTVLATLPAELVARLKAAARGLQVADDIVMLTAIGTALARFECRPVTTIAMIAPQRDGPGQGDLVGLFADIRMVSIRTEGLSYMGAALRLHHIVKERLWKPQGIMNQYSLPLVNFEWTDFDAHHGFRQLVNIRNSSEGLQNPIKVAVDQPDRATWRLRTAFDTAYYGEEDRERFFGIMQECFQALAEDPLAPIWP